MAPLNQDRGPTARTVLLHGGVYTASRFLNYGVVLILLPLYGHLLGTEGMGIVEIMTVARSFLAVVLAQGLEAAMFRMRLESRGDDRNRFESTIVWYLLGCSAVTLGVLFVFGDAIGAVLTPGIPFVPLGLWSAATAIAFLFCSLLERKLQSDQRPVAFGAFSLARTVATLSGIVLFVAVWKRGPAGKIEGEALAALATGLVAIVLIGPKIRASYTDLKKALGYGIPIVPHSIAGLVNDQVDRFVLNALLGVQAVGVYSMGYRLAGVALGMMLAQNQAFAPIFMETARNAEIAESEGRPDVAQALKGKIASLGLMNVLVGCTIAQIVAAGARELLSIATAPEFRDSWRVVAPVTAGVVSWTWYGTLVQSVLFRPESVRRLPLVTICAALANLGANFLLIPWLGIEGAAWATFVSNSALAAGAYYVGMRSMRIPYDFRRWTMTSVWAGACLLVTWQLDAHLDALAPRILTKAALLVVSIAVTMRLAEIRVQSLLDVVRGRRS